MGASAGKLVVGMDQKEVARLLRKSGAKRTKVDALPPSGPNYSGAVYELHGGGLLIVDYERASSLAPYLVSGLSVCKNPDLPKARRVWKNATQVKI
jgi:hypothetical protein